MACCLVLCTDCRPRTLIFVDGSRCHRCLNYYKNVDFWVKIEMGLVGGNDDMFARRS